VRITIVGPVQAGVQSRWQGGRPGFPLSLDLLAVYETRALKICEQIEATREIWTKDSAARFGGRIEKVPSTEWMRHRGEREAVS